jgi:Holliday junction resolvasome RuvABC endonuclease subunit
VVADREVEQQMMQQMVVEQESSKHDAADDAAVALVHGNYLPGAWVLLHHHQC